MSRPRTQCLVVLSIVLLAVLVFVTTPTTENQGGFDSDGTIYAKMVEGPVVRPDIPAPYRQRILTPRLASLLPGSLLDRFRLIARSRQAYLVSLSCSRSSDNLDTRSR